MKHKIYSIVSALLLVLAAVGCSKEPSSSGGFEGEETYKYFLLSALGNWPNTVHYMTGTNDVTQGEMDLKREGDEINSKGTYAYIVKNGYLYNYKTDQGVFKKMKYTKDRLETELEVPFTYINDVTSFTWVDDTTLLVLGMPNDSAQIRYAIFDTTTLKVIKQGVIEGLETFPKGYNHYDIGAIAYMDGVVYMQYGFRDDKWLTPTFHNFAAVGYSDFKVIKTDRDARSLGIGSGSPYFKNSFTKDNKTFYYTCYPRPETGQSDVYMFRAKTGEHTSDQSYSMNLSQVLGNIRPQTALDYIGDNKMIISYRDTSKGGSYNARYAIIDLETKRVVRTLTELPLDEPYELGFFTNDNKAYIAINSAEGGNYVWIYDLKTDKVTKGMSIPDKISGFARFDKFYDK